MSTTSSAKRRLRRFGGVFWVVAAGLAPVWSADAALSLVVCAPGYPGNTESAQPTMDAFASAVVSAAGLETGRLRAEYHQTLEGGRSRMDGGDAALALVGLPFYLTYREELRLEPLLEVEPVSGDSERFTLVARRGAVSGPESLEGWQIQGLHGYAPRFVRGVLLADWGRLPAGVDIRFTSRIVAGMRKAAAGEDIAVLLDAAQTAALPGLPFADQLEAVTQSAPVVASVLCSVRGRLPRDAREKLLPAMIGLSASPEGRTALESIRMRGFHEVDDSRLRRLEAAFASEPTPGPAAEQ